MNDTSQVLAILGATVIDGNGRPPFKDGVVIIDGARIADVGDRSTPIPPQAKRIDATGKFIIPGLMGASVFLADGVWLTTLIAYEGRYDQVAIEAAQITLKAGLTTVFDTWGPRDALIEARNAINHGQVIASRIYLAGNIAGYDGPFSRDFAERTGRFREAVPERFAKRVDSQWQLNVGQALVGMTPGQVRGEIREYVRSGIDFLDLAITDHRNFTSPAFLLFSPRVLQAIVEEAHHAGLPVMAFYPATEEGLVLALNAGVDLVGIQAPRAKISEEVVARIGQGKTSCVMTFDTMQVQDWYRGQAKIQPASGEYSTVEALNRRLLEVGAMPLLTTGGGVYREDQLESWRDSDATPPVTGFGCLGYSHVYQLQAMQESGMSPMVALMAMTRNVAKAFKVDKDLGTLERGKIADLLILDENPLESTEHYHSIHLLMKEGKVVDRDTLPNQRLITRRSGCEIDVSA